MKPHREDSGGMRSGRFLEAALLGRPTSFETGLPIKEAMQKGQLVSLLRQNIGTIMQQVRESQRDDPSFPKRPFLRRLLTDVEDALSKQYDLPSDYAVRIHSALGTVLDLGGVDFWVELYDEDKDRVLTDYKIDLKSNPEGQMGRMADYLFYCDEAIASNSDPKAIFGTQDYKDMVLSTTDHLARGINRLYLRSLRDENSPLQRSADLS